MLHIGLTGGIASGKSSAAKLFQAHGVTVLDADQAARSAVLPGSEGLGELVALFGTTILNQQGELDRKRLRQRIFANPTDREAVEQILHPRIAEIMLQQAAQVSAPYLIFMIPLLTDRRGGIYSIDRVLVIDLPESLQISRVMKRDQITRQQAEAIIQTQMERPQRLRMADDILLNLDPAELPQAVDRLHQQYLLLTGGE